MRDLVEVLKLTESGLKQKLYGYLISKGMAPVLEERFLYAEGDIPIMLVAHIDTVFEEPPMRLYYNEQNDQIFSCDDGIGGDDRCGVYAIMKILEEFKPYVLFTQGEEIGGVGAKDAVEKLPIPNVKYIIELDRRGSNDCVFYECNNNKFIDYVRTFGFEEAQGIFTDISILGYEWNIAAVNLSIGYYNEHTNFEYIKFNELQNNIMRVKLMLKKHKDIDFFEYKSVMYDKWQISQCLDNSVMEEDSFENENKHSKPSWGRKLILRKKSKFCKGVDNDN